MDHRLEQEALYDLDFGQPPELLFRFAATFFSAGIIYAYAGWWSSWIWAVGFSVWMGLYWLAHRHWKDRVNSTVIGGFHAAVLLLTIWYIWMPIKLIASNDTALALPGLTMLSCIYIFMMRQVDHSKRLVLGQITIMVSGSGIAVLLLVQKINSGLAVVALVSSWLAISFYFTLIMLIIRADRHRARLAAERSAQARKMEALGQMAGGVAHDFNNILTAAMGNLELAQILENEGERNECLGQAHASLGRAARVIRDLLQFASPSDATAKLRCSVELLAQINAISSHALPNAFQIEVDEAGSDLWVTVAEDQFSAAMMNLVINASHAAGSGGHIRLGARRFHLSKSRSDIGGHLIAPGDYVAFSVTDDGPGVPAQIVDRIAQPFFTTKQDINGTGLGLPMVHAFARRAGGGLLLFNKPGAARFSLLLPQQDSPHETSEERPGLVKAVAT